MPTKSHKELYSCNDEYNPQLNEKLSLLYQGGFAIQQKASLFLEKLQGLENDKAYQSRLKCTAYIPYLSEFITQFGASLFSEELEVKPPADQQDGSTQGDPMEDDFYKLFIGDCDLNGRSLHQFMQDVFECALHQLKVYIGLDFPRASEIPINRLEEEMMGLSKGYLYTIPYENVIDWKKDDRTKKYIWLKTFEECFPDDNPLEEAKHYFMFKIWTIQNGVGHWQVWQSELMDMKKSFTVNTKYTMTEEGDTSFPEVPIFDFHIPKGYHVGLQVGALCQEHYQRRSFMVSNANKTCVALGVMTLGPEVGAPGDGLPPDIEMMDTTDGVRKKLENDGWVVLRQTKEWSDKVEIVEAKGESHKFISEELKHLVESMMQTLRQMNMTASANMKSLGRSAASKMMDRHGTSMLLSVYDRRVKDFVKKLFTCLSAGRNEDIAWAVDGLSIAEPVAERKDVIEEVTKMGIDVQKFPAMFKNKYLYRLANELLDNNLSDKEKLELQEKMEELVAKGTFDAIDEQEATAAGNKMAKVTTRNDQAVSGDDTMTLGPAGQPLLPNGSHLQTGEHVDGQIVYNHLASDYKESDIQWVLHIPWIGPVEVPLTSLDFSNKDNWQATQDEGEVDRFADKMSKDAFSKPIVVVNNPSNDNKMEIVDGHHRALAALQNNAPVAAYVGQVGTDRGPWDKLHAKQVGSKQESEQSIQVSQQANETSVQKDAMKQVDKSERAKGGKTK